MRKIILVAAMVLPAQPVASCGQRAGLGSANHDDLRREQEESQDNAQRRRSKYFQSSAGHLKRKQK